MVFLRLFFCLFFIGCLDISKKGVSLRADGRLWTFRPRWHLTRETVDLPLFWEK